MDVPATRSQAARWIAPRASEADDVLEQELWTVLQTRLLQPSGKRLRGWKYMTPIGYEYLESDFSLKGLNLGDL